MDAYSAARKAFSKCKQASDRSVATFLARQYVIDANARLKCLPEIEKLLNDWFAQREADPKFMPPLHAIPEVSSAPLLVTDADLKAIDEAEDPIQV